MSDSPLPGYTFDTRVHQYRDLSTGRFVARRNIINLLEAEVTAVENALGSLAEAAHSGELSPSVFAEMFRTELRRAHSIQRALGAGGWAQMDDRDWYAVESALESERQHLEGFVEAIGTLTLAQALARAAMYAGGARVQFWEAEVYHRKPSDAEHVVLYMRSLSVAEHCQGCIDLHEAGWQYSLPVPGDGSTQCLSNCKCQMGHREVPTAEVSEWLGTRR